MPSPDCLALESTSSDIGFSSQQPGWRRGFSPRVKTWRCTKYLGRSVESSSSNTGPARKHLSRPRARVWRLLSIKSACRFDGAGLRAFSRFPKALAPRAIGNFTQFLRQKTTQPPSSRRRNCADFRRGSGIAGLAKRPIRRHSPKLTHSRRKCVTSHFAMLANKRGCGFSCSFYIGRVVVNQHHGKSAVPEQNDLTRQKSGLGNVGF